MDTKLKHQIALGVILIFVGITLILSNYISNKREEVFSNMNLVLSEKEDLKEEVEPIEEEEEEEIEEQVEDNTEDNTETYIGILEIPKIGFYRGFYDKTSPLNNVKINIKILDISSYPDEINGNVIIIGHSGNFSNSYFGNLYQLVKGDTATITYNDTKYTYQIDNIYTDAKDGTVTIYRDQTQNTLTLITCTKDDETKQTIYIMNLIKVE